MYVLQKSEIKIKSPRIATRKKQITACIVHIHTTGRRRDDVGNAKKAAVQHHRSRKCVCTILADCSQHGLAHRKYIAAAMPFSFLRDGM